MKSFASFAFGSGALALSLSASCAAFSPATTSLQRRASPASRSALFAADERRAGRHPTAGLAAAWALGLAVGAGPALAAPPVPAVTVHAGGGSSVTVAFSDADFTDFSLPSYKEVTAAAINTNLKGGTVLLEGGPSAEAASSSSGEAAAPAAEKKEPSAAEVKAAKAAAKAAQQAAREKQQAAVEAAIAAK